MLLGFFVGIVSPGSPNPKPISDQSLSFSLPVYRPGHLHLKVVNCGTLLGEGGGGVQSPLIGKGCSLACLGVNCKFWYRSRYCLGC